jgi:hypothetical protein
MDDILNIDTEVRAAEEDFASKTENEEIARTALEKAIKDHADEMKLLLELETVIVRKLETVKKLNTVVSAMDKIALETRSQRRAAELHLQEMKRKARSDLVRAVSGLSPANGDNSRKKPRSDGKA